VKVGVFAKLRLPYMQIAATQLRPGMVVKFNNDLFGL
jgi:hypothetical protein